MICGKCGDDERICGHNDWRGTVKEQLSDGIWAEYDADNDTLIISTDDNIVVLEADAWQALKSFAKRSMEL